MKSCWRWSLSLAQVICVGKAVEPRLVRDFGDMPLIGPASDFSMYGKNGIVLL